MQILFELFKRPGKLAKLPEISGELQDKILKYYGHCISRSPSRQLV
ncbi:MAG: hypothetical protein AB8U25_03305 [Rickettsiales endosymbiont of Dermacentor nuttalli]